MSVNDFLLDFATASVFIMLGQLLRAKVKFIQKFFIPASMLAGFMGLALGPLWGMALATLFQDEEGHNEK